MANRLFNFFSGTNNKKDKGITKQEAEYDKNLGFAFFFKLLKNKLGKLSASNLIFTLCNAFAFVALFGITGFLDDKTITAGDPLYAQSAAFYAAGGSVSPLTAALFTQYGVTVTLSVVSTASKVLRWFAAALVFTFGLSTVGLVYNIRNICNGKHTESWSDYFYAIKRNLKQGLAVGIIDLLIILLLGYDLIAYNANAGNSFMMLVFYYASILFAAVYYIMRFYIYIQLVTCNMTIGKMFKNALILAALGIKRNLAAFFSSLAFALLFVYIWILLPQFAVIFLCMFAVSFLTYIGVYCAYPNVKRYVIDPYYADHPEEASQDNGDESDSIFSDNG